MSRTYEIMCLIDNNLVRAGWKEAKASSTSLIEKHGGKVLSARRWDERALAYPIRQRRRGTYLLAYAEVDPAHVAALRRELDLTEFVLRYLILQAAEVPAEELTLAQAESEAGFVVPMPPPEEAHDDEAAQEPAQSDENDGDEADASAELEEEEV